MSHFSAWLRMLLITLIHISWSTSMYLLSHLWWSDFFDNNFPTVLFSLIQINQIYSQRTVKAQAIEANKIILSNTFCAPFPMTNMPIFLWQANIENMLVTTRNIVQFSHHMFLWSYVQNSVDDEKRRYMVAKTMYRQYLLITTPLYQQCFHTALLEAISQRFLYFHRILMPEARFSGPMERRKSDSWSYFSFAPSWKAWPTACPSVR